MESNELNSATDQCLGGVVSFLGLNVEATQKGRIARDNNDFIVDRVDGVTFRICLII